MWNVVWGICGRCRFLGKTSCRRRKARRKPFRSARGVRLRRRFESAELISRMVAPPELYPRAYIWQNYSVLHHNFFFSSLDPLPRNYIRYTRAVCGEKKNHTTRPFWHTSYSNAALTRTHGSTTIFNSTDLWERFPSLYCSLYSFLPIFTAPGRALGL